MNILAGIRREERRLEKQLGKPQRELDGLKAAAKALGGPGQHSVIQELEQR